MSNSMNALAYIALDKCTSSDSSYQLSALELGLYSKEFIYHFCGGLPTRFLLLGCIALLD